MPPKRRREEATIDVMDALADDNISMDELTEVPPVDIDYYNGLINSSFQAFANCELKIKEEDGNFELLEEVCKQVLELDNENEINVKQLIFVWI